MLVARRRAFATKSLTFLGNSLTDVKVEARAIRDYFLSPRIAFDAKPYTDPAFKGSWLVCGVNSSVLITSDQGVDLFRTSDIQEEAIRYFSNLFQFSLVNHTRASISSLRSFIDFRCSNEMQANLLQHVTTEEIPNCLFSMPLDKSPGSDGFPADLYRLTWDIVGPDFVVQTKRMNANQILVIKVREESIRSEEGGGAYISKYIKGILKSRLSRREQSRWNIMDDTTSMAFFEEFSSLNPVFHTFLFYGRLPSPFSRPFPEESGSSRMSMPWIPGFILVLIHSEIFRIYKNILGKRKANCLLAGSCMSGNVHVRFRRWTEMALEEIPALVFNGYANMILMRCGTLHLTFVGLPSSGACVPAFLCNKPLWPKISGRWSCVAFGEGLLLREILSFSSTQGGVRTHLRGLQVTVTRMAGKKKEGWKFRPLTVVLPIEKIMKEAIRMVLESIYDPEFPDTSHFCLGQGCHSEEIDDPKFFYSIHKVFSAGRLVGVERGPYSIPHSVLLWALPGNIYLHKLDQEIGKIRQKYEIPIVQRVRSVLLRTCRRIDGQENPREEASFNAPQDNRAIIVGSVRSMQCKAAFHSLVSSWHTPPQAPSGSGGGGAGDQKRPFLFPPSPALAVFLNKPSSLLCAAFLIEATGLTPKAEFDGGERCNNNWAMRDLLKYCKRKGLLIELGGEAILSHDRALMPVSCHCILPRVGRRRGREEDTGQDLSAANSPLRDRGIISRRRPWPIHVACLTNISDKDILNWSAGIAISPLSYYRCRDNLYQVRTIVDHQIRWSSRKKGSPFDLSQGNRLSDQEFLEKGYVIEAIVSPEECFSILPLIRYGRKELVSNEIRAGNRLASSKRSGGPPSSCSPPVRPLLLS
ncbi:LOW QUALITY PROTEIN: hypothetical protein HID58_042907 [Brassica napus]|uniref:Uncharacterized protein n=1 Tax=Brassica napus TaxID=3708 RepID=A0ABQ8BF26_BRANA|nr:LOW QUALITY PROTEIN: hypothetical protein HID58_042907 [Brassica napus]